MPISRSRDYGLILLASVLWGTSFPGSKLTVGTVDPLFLTFARLALGAALGIVVLAALRRLDLRIFREPIVWALGAVNALGFALQNEGIFLTTASKTALLVNVDVALTAAILVTSAIFATLPLFIIGWPWPASTTGWIGIFYLGLVPTFVPLMLYVASMRTISPTISALLILLEVVVAAILSCLLLRDSLDAFTFAGRALILLGASVVTRGVKSLAEPAAAGLAPVSAA